MTPSRRTLFQAVGAGALIAASAPEVLAADTSAQPPAQGLPAPPAPSTAPAAPQPEPPGFGEASKANNPVNIVSPEHLEAAARKMVSPGRFAITGWCGEGLTYRANRASLDQTAISPRRLQHVSQDAIDLHTSILGHKLPFPMITCPMGGHGSFHVDAEVATAGGTGAAGTLYVSSGASTRPMEDIAKATPGPKWFQIYMNRDMELNRWLVQRAKAAGFSAIVLTADALGPGQSDEYIALGRPRDPNLTVGNHDPRYGGHGNFADMKWDLSFSDIGFLHEASGGLPVITKGVVETEDIREALKSGAAAIWVSNHGGRQMDGGPGSFTMLRSAVDTVEGRVPIIFDSGVRRGVDVFKAVAMGATVCAVGRPVLWSLMCGGAPGVKSLYEWMAGELHSTMLLSGVAKVTDLKRRNLFLAKA
ncbi:MAG TPA: alpha-hydroxy-acid oxidizing protein [Stellaceae bacterium]|nr:alpha-hydroxy-acid oxidizing protein [Stellaceae bacterium]